MKIRMNALLLIGLIGTFTNGTYFLTQIARAYWGDRNMWWTPAKMAIPFEDTGDKFEIFIRGKLLRGYLADTALYVKSGEAYEDPVSSEDLKVRLNNWYRVKSSILSNAILGAFLLGVSLACLTVGLIRILSRRERKSETESRVS